MRDVVDCIEANAAGDPDRLLYSFLDVRGVKTARLTRAALWLRIGELATSLRNDVGLKPGDRVMLAYPAGLEMICAFFACAYAGLVPAPTAAPTAFGLHAALLKMAYIARDCDATTVLTTASVRDLVAARGSEPDPDLTQATTRWRWIATDEVTCGHVASGVRRSSSLLFLQYTSGSTSAPKGVMVTHDNILANAAQLVDHEDPVGVTWLPQHHDMGLIGYYINNAIAGAKLYGFSPISFIQRPALWLEAITRYRATATSAPNFAFEYCLQSGRIPPAKMEALDLSSLKILMAGAEPVKAAVYEAFLQAFMPYGLRRESLMVAYGLAENTLAVSSRGRTRLSVRRRDLAHGRARVTRTVSDVSDATHLMSCGRALGDTQVMIVDPDSRLALAAGRVGEIWVTGSSKCRGYWRQPEATAATFEARLAGAEDDQEAPVYLRTGDLGFSHDGELYVCGRRKDMIIIRGQNHYPQDIEAVVEEASSAVRPGCVAAFETGGDGDSRVTVVAEVAGAATPDGAAIFGALRRRLGIEADDLYFVSARSVPKTTSGKVMRFKVRDMLASGGFIILHHVAGRRDNDDEPTDEAGLALPFASFRRRYKLSGEEDITLLDAGLDSLDLVVFLHEFAELLAAHGVDDVAEDVDFKLIQQLTVAEIFQLVARVRQDPATASRQIRRLMRKTQQASRDADGAMMAADRFLGFEPIAPSAPPGPLRTALLTGATGFLGPFLLSSLLTQTEAKVYALVRADSPEEGQRRLREALREAASEPAILAAFDERVVPVPGDLAAPGLGLDDAQRSRLAEVDAIYHNGALVNYLFTYGHMRAANVLGTREILRLAFEGRPKAFNHISTTFVFGWATKDVLLESDENEGMELLDFGYSQTKWVSEQLVLDARRRGLATRIFRPALITPSLAGTGGGFDITLRLLAFMVRHGISVRALNQVSFVPADVTAHNIVALSRAPATVGQTLHVTRDVYVHMGDVLSEISRLTGRRFELFDLPDFVPEVIRRCTLDDPLFPLLDFLRGSIDNISSMEFKRYDNTNYQRAKAATPSAMPDPSLKLTVAGILRFMRVNGMGDLSLKTPDPREFSAAAG